MDGRHRDGWAATTLVARERRVLAADGLFIVAAAGCSGWATCPATRRSRRRLPKPTQRSTSNRVTSCSIALADLMRTGAAGLTWFFWEDATSSRRRRTWRSARSRAAALGRDVVAALRRARPRARQTPAPAKAHTLAGSSRRGAGGDGRVGGGGCGRSGAARPERAGARAGRGPEARGRAAATFRARGPVARLRHRHRDEAASRATSTLRDHRSSCPSPPPRRPDSRRPRTRCRTGKTRRVHVADPRPACARRDPSRRLERRRAGRRRGRAIVTGAFAVSLKVPSSVSVS